MTSDDAAAARTGRREVYVGLLCAALLLSLWASFILMSRFGVRSHAFTPPDLVALRVGIGGLVILPWFLRQGFGGLTFFKAIILALTAGVGFGAFSFSASVFAPVSHAAALQTGALPLYTSALAVFVLRERFSRGKLLGLALIVAGVAVIAYDSLSVGEPGQWRGDILFSVASLDWALYAVFAQRWRVRPLQAAAVVYVVSAVLYLPVYFTFFEPQLLKAPPFDLAIQAILQGVLVNLVSMLLFMRVVQAFGASSTAMLTAAAPTLVTVLSIPFLGERPSLFAWAGLACVTLGVVATIKTLQAHEA